MYNINNSTMRVVLPAVLRVHNPAKPYLPSSPYLSDEILGYRNNNLAKPDWLTHAACVTNDSIPLYKTLTSATLLYL
ncbi:MAG: hypothetical protein IJ303_05935 [Clostridia bacterium]|nr:hypothetical protein [Clostridia bacterium]